MKNMPQARTLSQMLTRWLDAGHHTALSPQEGPMMPW
jgi:hypothetical protein